MSVTNEMDFGAVRVVVDDDAVVRKVGLIAKRLEDDGSLMKELADLMVGGVRDNIEHGAFVPVLPATLRRRGYPFHPRRGAGARGAVGETRPLLASRALFTGISPRSKPGYAAAQRGKPEWYAFLQDGGVGRLDQRPFMNLSPGLVEALTGRSEAWLDDVVEKDEE